MTTIKKIDTGSIPALDSSLAIFDLPPSNVAINKSTFRELLPLTTITQNGPYIFRIFADSQFIDLKGIGSEPSGLMSRPAASHASKILTGRGRGPT